MRPLHRSAAMTEWHDLPVWQADTWSVDEVVATSET
jgi:hypothetical protein